MDILTILTIGDRLVRISVAAFNAFRQAVADSGGDAKTLAALDAKYDAAIAHELAIQDRTS